jgi:hypothetical protein
VDGAFFTPEIDCEEAEELPEIDGAADGFIVVFAVLEPRFLFFGGRPRFFFPTFDLIGVEALASFATAGELFFLGGLPRFLLTTGSSSSVVSSTSFLGGLPLPLLFGSIASSISDGFDFLVAGGLPRLFLGSVCISGSSLTSSFGASLQAEQNHCIDLGTDCKGGSRQYMWYSSSHRSQISSLD